MAKVLILANDNSTIYNFRRELLARLVAEGFDVTVALPAHSRNQAFRDLGCDVIETPLSRFGTNPLAEFAAIGRFVKIVRSENPEVVLTFTAKPNIYGGLAAQLCRVPYIGAVTGLGAAFQSEGLLKAIISVLYRMALRKADRVFFENSDNAATLRELRIVGDNLEVVSGAGVNLETHALEPYCEDRNRTHFITVARVRRDKGYDELFEVIRRVCARRDDVDFQVVGWYEDEGYRDVVEEMRRRYPVTFHDEVSQQRVHDLIAESHGLIHPSHHEGMANVILEASASGIPCLVSDIPGCRESVEDHRSGLLFPVRDADALCSAVDAFLATDWEKRREMGLAARRKMEAEFDRELVVDRYVREIRRACSRSKQEAGV